MEAEYLEKYDTFLIPAPANNEDTEDDIEPITSTDADGKRQLVGYAVVWGAVSDVRRDGFKHRFQKGSISWTPKVDGLWNHDYGTPLGSNTNQTLSIAEDDHGIKIIMDLDDTTDGNNAWTRVKAGLVSGMSFGGRRLAYDRTEDPKIIDVTSFVANEVSLTMVPGMTETNIVTADNVQKLEQQKKVAQMKLNQAALDKAKLTTLIAGRVSAGRVANRK